MERLSAVEIWRFLDQTPVGRLAIHDHAADQTQLTPVFFACEGGRVYFATQPGRKLTLLRQFPQGVGVQCDAHSGDAWISVFGWGRFRAVGAGPELGRAAWLLARKYRQRYVQQIGAQALQALRGGPLAVWKTLRGATTGCIDLERIGGRRWSDDEAA